MFRLLVIDEVWFNRQLVLTTLLGRIGCEVIAVGTQSEGLERLQEGKFDLVIVELLTPVAEFVSRMRENPSSAETPAIVAVGGESGAADQALFGSGNLLYPLEDLGDRSKLLETIHDALDPP